jgi:hypothetical protein
LKLKIASCKEKLQLAINLIREKQPHTRAGCFLIHPKRSGIMDISTMGTVLAIVVITYLIGLLCKTISAIKDELIPVIVGAVGGVLGILGMYVIPDFPAKDVLNALAVGIVSGLASTGVNQVYKQLGKAEIDPGGD